MLCMMRMMKKGWKCRMMRVKGKEGMLGRERRMK